MPPGNYLLGSLQLKSNVELRLSASAKLLASVEKSDYDFSRKCPRELSPQTHLIWAREAENVSITGMGTIDGRGDLFFGLPMPGLWHLSLAAGWRPDRLIAFILCRNVLMEGVRVINSPGWAIWPLGCDEVRIHRISIISNRWGPNTDGIDPDCSRHVHISDCHLDTGDDCIALKSSVNLLDQPRACEDIVVTNCTLRSTTCGIRIGYEADAPIRNCSFSNLVMSETRTGIAMQVPRELQFGIQHGPTIDNIRFANIVMDTHLPFFLWTGHDASSPGGIRDIRFSGIRATAGRGSYFGGSRTLPIECLRLCDVEICVGGEMDAVFAVDVPDPYRPWEYLTKSGPNAKRGLPHALYFRDAQDVSLNDVRITWGAESRVPGSAVLSESSSRILAPVPKTTSGAWRSALRCERVANLQLAGLVASAAPGQPMAPAVHLSDVARVYVQGCIARPHPGTFLVADGATGKISAMANDLSDAGQMFDVPKESLFKSS